MLEGDIEVLRVLAQDPLFIAADAPFWPQFAVLSATYLAIDALFLTGYGRGADWIAQKLAGPRRALVDRLGGGLMIGAAVLLGLRPVEH